MNYPWTVTIKWLNTWISKAYKSYRKKGNVLNFWGIEKNYNRLRIKL